MIIGKSGFKIDEKDALDYVWGYTIINDVTARERQRDHKQFYIGKSPDTFCPMVSLMIPCWKQFSNDKYFRAPSLSQHPNSPKYFEYKQE